ncbi:hypothetical protein [Sphingobium subterraneum]|uniref:Uncharacterized protein n=1 Tax=Sphingobium subterraneum TaxID=627688 RepID=A0A841J9T7_9SPHN|nr:hypothetical protein [Sphingobium subterraneum]MBB6124911.1 hypothetical protein [Sphingobium subterraneum]
MTEWVSKWVQEGRLWIWRYANPRRDWRGWHFSADPAGCRSVRNLLDRMSGGGACHRTLKLDSITDDVLRVPNYDQKSFGQFSRVRIEYQPDAQDLSLHPENDRLVLTVGNRRLQKLASAFTDVEIDGGDFGIRTSDNRRAEHWMFWWPPRERN